MYAEGEKNQGTGIAISNFKTYMDIFLIKAVWYCHKTDKLNRTRNSETYPHTHS